MRKLQIDMQTKCLLRAIGTPRVVWVRTSSGFPSSVRGDKEIMAIKYKLHCL